MKIILSPQPPPLLSFWFQAFRLSHRWKAKQCAAHGPSRIFTDVAETCCPSGKELTRKAITWVHQPATVFTDTSSRLIRINRHNPKSGIDMKSELWQSHPWPFRPHRKNGLTSKITSLSCTKQSDIFRYIGWCCQWLSLFTECTSLAMSFGVFQQLAPSALVDRSDLRTGLLLGCRCTSSIVWPALGLLWVYPHTTSGWLVVWNMFFLQYWEFHHQLTKSCFSEGWRKTTNKYKWVRYIRYDPGCFGMSTRRIDARGCHSDQVPSKFVAPVHKLRFSWSWLKSSWFTLVYWFS